jgi:hypothetical protein
MYWESWPVAHPFLLFEGVEFKNEKWLAVWKKLDHNLQIEEVVRKMPIRNPIIWLGQSNP